MIRRLAALCVVVLGLASCGGPKGGGYYEGDGPPSAHGVDVAAIPDAVPRKERPSATGNQPYTVNGRGYRPMHSARGYDERGVASWYGTKFHGRSTSSGEPYDMFGMTAAHRTLPLPSYVRVTNLNNGRSVVVKVNDRGPFHSNRLIDLSYAAAYKLGVVATGTAPVEVTAVFADDPPLVHASASLPPRGGKPRLYVQVGAFIDHSNAESLRDRLAADQDSPVLIQTAQSGGTAIYRVRIGPLHSVEEGDRVIADIDRHGIRDPKLVIE